MTTRIDEVPEFTEHFRKYGFDWMIRAPGRYIEVLVLEFYKAYKCKLIRLFPWGMLWNGCEPVASLVIKGVYVDISSQTIKRFLYGPAYQAPANTAKMDYRIEKMRKITNQTLGMDEKMLMF